MVLLSQWSDGVVVKHSEQMHFVCLKFVQLICGDIEEKIIAVAR